VHVLMVADAYPPLRTSCAVQMYDLGQAFIEEGHQVSIITPSYGLKEKIKIELDDGVHLIRVRAFQTKGVNYIYRTFAEFINPFLIWSRIKKSPKFLDTRYDGIIWYSPTIFWGALIKKLKQQFKVKAYLILRDIFPDWALDLGLIKKGLAYKFLKTIECYQYQQADVIGVQSPNNLEYFKKNNFGLKCNVEVLWNWIGNIKENQCSVDLSKTKLAGKKIFVYAGNMGVAQEIDNIIYFAEMLGELNNAGFLLVGRGTEVERIKRLMSYSKLNNFLFLDEIPFTEIPGLLSQCTIGLLTLDSRHQTHNIPGKFITYLSSGLPVIGAVNKGNDLVELVRSNQVGILCEEGINSIRVSEVLSLISETTKGNEISMRCKNIAQSLFASKTAVQTISNAFK